MYLKECVFPGMQKDVICHFDFGPVCIDFFEWCVETEYHDTAEKGVEREKRANFDSFIS